MYVWFHLHEDKGQMKSTYGNRSQKSCLWRGRGWELNIRCKKKLWDMEMVYAFIHGIGYTCRHESFVKNHWIIQLSYVHFTVRIFYLNFKNNYFIAPWALKVERRSSWDISGWIVFGFQLLYLAVFYLYVLLTIHSNFISNCPLLK